MAQTRARLTDPVTSHEAAEAVQPHRSQVAVLKCARGIGDFTDKQLIAEYLRWREPHDPMLSESRIRTARKELVDEGRIEAIGYTQAERGRRETIWRLTDGPRV